MKKILFSLLLGAGLAASTTSPLKAQDNAVKINIISPLVSTLSLFYERKLNEKSSAQLGFLYTGFSISETKFKGIAITPEYRFYLGSDGALRGFYVGPYLRYQNLTMTVPYTDYVYDEDGFIVDTKESDASASLNTFGGGVVIGHQWLIKDRFAIDIFGGPGMNSGSIKVKAGSESATFDGKAFDGFTFRTGLTLGVAF